MSKVGGPARKKFRVDERGQSTLEFILSFVLVIAFILFYFQLALVFGYGSFVQYATYMASRAYTSASKTEGDQEIRACEVMTSYLGKSGGSGCGISAGQEKYAILGKGDGSGGSDMGITGFAIRPAMDSGKPFNPATRDTSWQQGARYTFKSRIFMIPLTGFGKGAENKNETDPDGTAVTEVRLTSESWLNREPSERECADLVDAKEGTFDNGC